jgi:transposase
MYLHTNKQKEHFEEVIRLHYDKGYRAKRISRILPIGHSTVSRWLAIFSAENTGKSVQMRKTKSQVQPSTVATDANAVATLQAEIVRLKGPLRDAKLRADSYDEMIHVGESRFKISIRKKTVAKR